MITRFGCIVLLSSFALADTVSLRNGTTVEGTYLGGDARQIRIASGDRVQTLNVDDVSSIQFGRSSAASAAPAPREQRLETREQRAPVMEQHIGVQERPDPDRRAQYNSGREIPAGTNFVIRMIDGIDSQRDRVGQTFQASLEEPVMQNGETVIPRGADVTVKLVDDKQSGKLTGKTELTVDIVAVRVDGRMVDIDTQSVTQASSSRTSRSAKVVGGTAALGAVIGAIAGGGRGAAIGATSGAGVGAAAQVLTKGQQVKIPSETRLTFTLDQAVRL